MSDCLGICNKPLSSTVGGGGREDACVNEVILENPKDGRLVRSTNRWVEDGSVEPIPGKGRVSAAESVSNGRWFHLSCPCDEVSINVQIEWGSESFQVEKPGLFHVLLYQVESSMGREALCWGLVLPSSASGC